MTQLVRSFRYPVAALQGQQLDELAAALPERARLVYHLEVEAATYPEALRLIADTNHLIVSAGLPPAAWQGGSDVCPGCGRPEDTEGSEETEGEGVLFT